MTHGLTIVDVRTEGRSIICPCGKTLLRPYGEHTGREERKQRPRSVGKKNMSMDVEVEGVKTGTSSIE